MLSHVINEAFCDNGMNSTSFVLFKHEECYFLAILHHILHILQIVDLKKIKKERKKKKKNKETNKTEV